MLAGGGALKTPTPVHLVQLCLPHGMNEHMIVHIITCKLGVLWTLPLVLCCKSGSYWCKIGFVLKTGFLCTWMLLVRYRVERQRQALSELKLIAAERGLEVP